MNPATVRQESPISPGLRKKSPLKRTESSKFFSIIFNLIINKKYPKGICKELDYINLFIYAIKINSRNIFHCPVREKIRRWKNRECPATATMPILNASAYNPANWEKDENYVK